MVDHRKEKLIRLDKIFIPGNPTTKTRFRWTTDGVGGVKLDSTLVGRKRYTSNEAVDRFLATLNASPKPDQVAMG